MNPEVSHQISLCCVKPYFLYPNLCARHIIGRYSGMDGYCILVPFWAYSMPCPPVRPQLGAMVAVRREGSVDDIV